MCGHVQQIIRGEIPFIVCLLRFFCSSSQIDYSFHHSRIFCTGHTIKGENNLGTTLRRVSVLSTKQDAAAHPPRALNVGPNGTESDTNDDNTTIGSRSVARVGNARRRPRGDGKHLLFLFHDAVMMTRWIGDRVEADSVIARINGKETT